MLRSLSRWLTVFETVSLAAGTAAAVAVATVQVLLRYVGGTGLFWAEEFTVYALIWTAFVAGGAAVRTGEHLTVELLQVAIGPRYAQSFARGMSVIGLAASAGLLFYSIEFVLTVREYEQVSPALQWPMWIVYLAIPLGGTLLCLRFVEQIVAPKPAGHLSSP